MKHYAKKSDKSEVLALSHNPSYINNHEIKTTSWSSLWQAHTNTSSIVIIMGSQPSFFHGILMLNLPTRPAKNDSHDESMQQKIQYEYYSSLQCTPVNEGRRGRLAPWAPNFILTLGAPKFYRVLH